MLPLQQTLGCLVQMAYAAYVLPCTSRACTQLCFCSIYIHVQRVAYAAHVRIRMWLNYCQQVSVSFPKFVLPPKFHTACRYEVLYNQLGLSRLIEYCQIGLLDPTTTITMKVSSCQHSMQQAINTMHLLVYIIM